METTETNEGIIYCSVCDSALSKSEIENNTCSHCWQVNNSPIDDYEDDDEFDRCSSCDGHDACADFGCAIKAGLGHLVKQPL